MMMNTSTGTPMCASMFVSYMRYLVGRFFKILPIKESGEDTLTVYIDSLQSELMGCQRFLVTIQDDPEFITLLSILQYMKDNPDCSVKCVRREVFRAINICNRLKAVYSDDASQNADTEVCDV